ncbi:MAG: methylmalonyl Co-A mutase-associated GTPase MeaB [Chloroherpetonaceae bacterium]|nr:methylmalonyl Co-A mutase-associated GTPase MeaB [Chloroherpetonaceae bacterium]MDW8437156.1 methylmalonyl Co-A mutase-associated GTPase MeaB [Chloroherpetonaceae bacterium]
MTSSPSFLERIRLGDKRALSRLLTQVENDDAEVAPILAELSSPNRRAYRIGITGPPGAGKSTLAKELVKAYRKSQQTVAVVAVDPTSPFTGGALLGDRIRMSDVMLDSGVFIRSMATRGSLGGLAAKAAEVSRVLEAAGYDIIIFETVGVGQSELDIVKAADTIVVALVPESGDSVQAMKAGLMEIADVFAMNKADRADSDKAVQALESSLELRERSVDAWRVPVVKTVAMNGVGISDLRSAIETHRAYLQSKGLLEKKRQARDQELVERLVEEKWRRAFWTESRREFLAQKLSERLSPYLVADLLFSNDEQT